MAILDFPNTGLVANVTQYTGDNGTTYTWDGVKWIGRAAGVISGTTNKLVNVANEVVLEADGSITLPTLTTLDWDRRDLVGPTLQMGNDPTVSDAVITGPAPDLTNPNAVRLIIQGQEGFELPQSGGAEGGDVYVWAGHGGEGNNYSGDGGDVKLRGGIGGLNGGYIRLESGDANAPNGIGGFLDLNAGNGGATGGTGGNVNINAGGGNSVGGNVNINAGQGDTNTGGNVSITAGYGPTNGGKVAIETGNGYWQFKPDGSFAINGSEVHIATNNWGIQAGGGTGATGVVYTAKNSDLASIRVHATIEGNEDGDTTGFHTQACDMMIVRRISNTSVNTVDAVVYGVIYTGIGPLATLNAQWNNTSSRIEITATPVSSTNNVYVKIYATEVARGD